MMRKMQEAARAKGVQLRVLKAGTENEIDGAFTTLVQEHVDALVVSNDTFFFSARDQLVVLAERCWTGRSAGLTPLRIFSSWSSISKPPRHSALPFRRRYSPAPTR